MMCLYDFCMMFEWGLNDGDVNIENYEETLKFRAAERPKLTIMKGTD